MWRVVGRARGSSMKVPYWVWISGFLATRFLWATIPGRDSDKLSHEVISYRDGLILLQAQSFTCVPQWLPNQAIIWARPIHFEGMSTWLWSLLQWGSVSDSKSLMPLWMKFVQFQPGYSQSFSEDKRLKYQHLLKTQLQYSDVLIAFDSQTDQAGEIS